MKVWKDIKEISDEEQHVKKFIYTKDDAVAESVLYRYPDYLTRTVICCSVQSGCPIGCRFCGSGDYFVRNLTIEEILDQIAYSLRNTGIKNKSEIKTLQIMYMSMGEPMLNLQALLSVIDLVSLCFPNAANLISTIAPRVDFDPLFDAARENSSIGLQFSIHESTDEKRNALIPFKKKNTLNEISQLGWMFWKATGRKAFINYCAHEHNSSLRDAANLHKIFDPKYFSATVSVVCERNDGLPATNEFQKELARDFANALVAFGYDTRVFDPAGQDTIGGGCGQLWYVQDWMKNNPDKARPSCGQGLNVVHVPVLSL